MDATDIRTLLDPRWLTDGAGLTVVNPATDEPIATVRTTDPDAVRAAVDRAEEAQARWRAVSPWDRASALTRLAGLMIRDRERLARLLTLEQGKPLREARGEIRYAATFLEEAAGEATRVRGEILPARRSTHRIMVLRQPLGIAAAITPWNFPSAMITRKLGPALAAGCAMLVKPAEQTPLSALALRDLATEAGIPEHVFAVVVGDPGPIGDVFFSDARVRAVSFTGSTEVGKLLMKKAADTVTRLSLELGGHAPFLVFDDADLHAAVEGAVASKFRNAGQTCICANRFLIQDGIYDAFTARLAQATERLRLGSGLDEEADVGPLIDDAGVHKVLTHIDDAVSRGARLRMGGRRCRPGQGLTDRFVSPAILEDVTGEMQVFREETFGPVAPLRRFTTFEDAVRMANDTPYGLAAYFYTRDAGRVMRLAEALEYGIVGANDAVPSTAEAPFGGIKQSGIGREGSHLAMDEFLDVKYVSFGL